MTPLENTLSLLADIEDQPEYRPEWEEILEAHGDYLSGDILVELGQCFDQINEREAVDDAVDRIDELLQPFVDDEEEEEDEDEENEDSEDEDEDEDEEEEVTIPSKPAPLKIKPVDDVPACVVCEDDDDEDIDLGCELCEDDEPEPEPLAYKHEIIDRPKVTANGWIWTGWNNNNK